MSLSFIIMRRLLRAEESVWFSKQMGHRILKNLSEKKPLVYYKTYLQYGYVTNVTIEVQPYKLTIEIMVSSKFLAY